MQLNETLSLTPLISQANIVDCQQNFGAFCEIVREFKNNWHHNEWAEILQNRAYQYNDTIYFDPDGEYVIDNKWIMLMAPRSHAKPNVRIVIVSASMSISTSFVREITQELELNDKFKAVFGNLVPDKPIRWTNSEILVERTKTKLKDPTVSATSIGGTVLSKRADIIICDDILNDQNTRTAEQRAKVRQWFFEVLLPVLEPDGQLIVVGTAWNSEDLYHQLMGDDSFQIRKRYDAIVDEEKKITLWESRWSWDQLMKLKRSMGTPAFFKSYRNIVLSAEDAKFKVDWINRAKFRGRNRRLMRTLDYASWDLGQLVMANGIDLAISEKSTGDFTAMMVLGRTRDGMKIPIWAIREKLSPAQTRAKIIEIHKTFAPVGLQIHKVETNGYQESIRRDVADETELPISGHNTGSEKFDETVGINSMAIEFENDKWIIPYDKEDTYTRELMDYFCNGLLSFPSGHTEDLVMAGWFANTGLRDLTVGTDQGEMTTGRHSIFNRGN